MPTTRSQNSRLLKRWLAVACLTGVAGGCGAAEPRGGPLPLVRLPLVAAPWTVHPFAAADQAAFRAFSDGRQSFADALTGALHGQILSGFLWDLRKNDVMQSPDLAALTLKAVSYFKKDSGLRDFMLSVLMADRELFQCKYDAQIRQFAHARALDTLIPDAVPGCAAIPLPTGSGLTSPSSTGVAHSSGKKQVGCGSAGVDAAAPWWLLALALAPAAGAARRRRGDG